MTGVWVVEPSPSAEDALDRVGAELVCSNISMEIVANDGKAWRRPFSVKRRRAKKRSRKSPKCIFAQGNFTHVWKNLKAKFGTAARIKRTTFGSRKTQVFYLLRNTRTNDYIAIGNVHGAFRMWTRFEGIDQVPEGLMKDILALVAELWKGEKWGVVPTAKSRKSTRPAKPK